MVSPLQLSCGRVAREQADGQYKVLCFSTTLSIAEDTITVTIVQPRRNLVHLPLTSVMFALADCKLMMVPANRGPALVVELSDAKDVEAVVGLLSCVGIEVHGPPASVGIECDPAELANLESLLEWRELHGQEECFKQLTEDARE
jgi:hypothetical protein